MQTLLGLYNVNFIFNFASTNVKYNAHVAFALFAIILIIGGILNVFSSHLLALFNRVSVWWNVIGVAVIVVILVAVPEPPPERLVRVRPPDQQLGLPPTLRTGSSCCRSASC